MNLSRHEVRVNAVLLIYQTLMRDDDIRVLYAIAEESDLLTVTKAVRETVDGTLAHVGEIDGIIQQFSPSRVVARIPKLLLAILRVAVYEILYNDRVAVSEAMKIVREYSYFDEDARFVNGLLGAFVRSRTPDTESAQA